MDELTKRNLVTSTVTLSIPISVIRAGMSSSFTLRFLNFRSLRYFSTCEISSSIE